MFKGNPYKIKVRWLQCRKNNLETSDKTSHQSNFQILNPTTHLTLNQQLPTAIPSTPIYFPPKIHTPKPTHKPSAHTQPDRLRCFRVPHLNFSRNLQFVSLIRWFSADKMWMSEIEYISLKA